MSFRLDFSKQATNFIRSLSNNLKERIKNKFTEIIKDPFRYLEHFEGKNCYKIRIGDYRGLIDVDFDRKILFVQVFDKRARVYKK